jgi:hypothetical protein
MIPRDRLNLSWVGVGFVVVFAALLLIPVEVIRVYVFDIGASAASNSYPENEPERTRLLLPILIPKGAEDDFGPIWHGNVIDVPCLAIGRNPIIKPIAHEDRPSRSGGAFDFLPRRELHVVVRKESGSFPIVGDIDAKAFSCGPSHDVAAASQVGAFNIGECFGGPGRSLQGPCGGVLQAVGGPPKSAGENSDNNCPECRPPFWLDRLKMFHPRDNDALVFGATLIAAAFILIGVIAFLHDAGAKKIDARSIAISASNTSGPAIRKRLSIFGRSLA